MTKEQKDFIEENYGGSMSIFEMSEKINVHPKNFVSYINSVSVAYMFENFKHFKRIKEREFYSPFEEPDMERVGYSIDVQPNMIIHTFQSRINY